MYQCSYCINQYTTRQAKSRHKKKCNKRPISQILESNRFSCEVLQMEKKTIAELSIQKYENFVIQTKKEIETIKVSSKYTEFDKILADEKRKFIDEITKIYDPISGNEKTRTADGSIPDGPTHAVSYDDIIDREKELGLERLLLEFKEKFLAEEKAYRLALQN
jgi:hypothetical protein